MTTREAVIKSVAVLTTAFNRENSATLTEAYQLGLSDLTADEVAAATKQALSDCKFMPTPSELKAIVRPKANIQARAAAAWIAVRGAIRRYDYTVASIDFGPLVNTVLRAMGSWEWLCERGDEAMKWEAKKFAELFEAFASSPAESLRSEPIRSWGANRVGCEIATVAIAGELPPIDPRRTLPEPPNPMRDLVRELAEEKS